VRPLTDAFATYRRTPAPAANSNKPQEIAVPVLHDALVPVSPIGKGAAFLKRLQKGLAGDLHRGFLWATLVGLIAGFGAVIFRNLIGLFGRLFFEHGEKLLSALGPYAVILIPAAGGLLVGPLIYFFAREAKGHGVPEVMLAVAKEGGRIRARVALVKILASALSIGSGGSVGREGPIVQIGATFGSVLAQRLKLSQEWIRTLVACGAAGGISATFNAPIAGVFFALEVILGRFSTRYFSVVVVASVVAAVTSHSFFPDIANLTVPPMGWQAPGNYRSSPCSGFSRRGWAFCSLSCSTGPKTSSTSCDSPGISSRCWVVS
jgi:H+/Cl- antiporter ClcA